VKVLTKGFVVLRFGENRVKNKGVIQSRKWRCCVFGSRQKWWSY